MLLILYFVLIIVSTFLLAKILIPVLLTILILFSLIFLTSPFFTFITIGYMFGAKGNSIKERARKFKREKKQ